jgi:hypothetical protein
MYQVTWSRERTLPHDMVRKFETWKEVQSWKADLDARDDVMDWTIALIVDSRFEDQARVDTHADKEKSALITNICRVLPDNLTDEEVPAALMTIGSVYANSPEEMAGLFCLLQEITQRMLETKPEERTHH